MGKEVNTQGPFYFSARVMNSMHNAGFSIFGVEDERTAAQTVAEFYAWCMSFEKTDDGSLFSRRNWKYINNFGPKSFSEVQDFVRTYGLQREGTRQAFGYDVPVDVYYWLRKEAQRRSVS